jgi:hypothetical protein
MRAEPQSGQTVIAAPFYAESALVEHPARSSLAVQRQNIHPDMSAVSFRMEGRWFTSNP